MLVRFIPEGISNNESIDIFRTRMSQMDKNFAKKYSFNFALLKSDSPKLPVRHVRNHYFPYNRFATNMDFTILSNSLDAIDNCCKRF